MRIALGDKVKHVVSGFVGIAVSRTEYLADCVRIGVQARVGKDRKIPEISYCDEGELKVAVKGAVKLQKTEEPKSVTGGYRPAPIGRTEPRR